MRIIARRLISAVRYDGRSAIILASILGLRPLAVVMQYFILHNTKRRTQTIIVRGTANSPDWSEDMDTHGYFDKKTDILVHRGYDKIARANYKDLKKHLKARLQVRPMQLTAWRMTNSATESTFMSRA